MKVTAPKMPWGNNQHIGHQHFETSCFEGNGRAYNPDVDVTEGFLEDKASDPSLGKAEKGAEGTGADARITV